VSWGPALKAGRTAPSSRINSGASRYAPHLPRLGHGQLKTSGQVSPKRPPSSPHEGSTDSDGAFRNGPPPGDSDMASSRSGQVSPERPPSLLTARGVGLRSLEPNP
jgi:hypothetical protein